MPSLTITETKKKKKKVVFNISLKGKEVPTQRLFGDEFERGAWGATVHKPLVGWPFLSNLS